MTREELRDYVDEQRTLDNIPYHVYSALIDGIDALEQEPKWIPVSERLPKKYSYVLVSTDAEEIFITAYLGKMNDGTDCFDDDDGMIWEGVVIAWMPLPPCYKPQERNE